MCVWEGNSASKFCSQVIIKRYGSEALLSGKCRPDKTQAYVIGDKSLNLGCIYWVSIPLGNVVNFFWSVVIFYFILFHHHLSTLCSLTRRKFFVSCMVITIFFSITPAATVQRHSGFCLQKLQPQQTGRMHIWISAWCGWTCNVCPCVCMNMCNSAPWIPEDRWLITINLKLFKVLREKSGRRTTYPRTFYHTSTQACNA